MNLVLEPQIVHWPPTHYVFLEKIGPFMQTAPKAWQELHQLKHLIAEHNRITGAMSLYKMKPDIYRAGFILSEAAVELPSGLEYEEFTGGKYSKFVHTGSYLNLGPASGLVWEYVAKNDILLRSDFAIENYANDPQSTPEAELITEILVPTV